MYEYRNIFESKKWENTDSKKISKHEPLIMKASTVVIEAPVNKIVDKVYFKSRHNRKYNNSGVGLYTKSVATCHKCVKKGHMKSNCKSNINGSYGGLSKRSTRKLPKWVTKKSMISDLEYMTTATMNQNKNQ